MTTITRQLRGAFQLRSRVAFSFVELLVVLAIVGILGAIASFGFKGLFDRGRLAEAVNTVESRVNAARLDSKRRDVSVNVGFLVGESNTFTVNGTTYSLPGGAIVVSEAGLVMEFSPPFGTWDGVAAELEVRAGSANAVVAFVGVLAKPVVTQ